MAAGTTTVPSCSDVFSACEKAITEQKAQITIRDQELGQAQAMLQTQYKEIQQLDEEAHAWYKSPYLYLFLGLGAGFYLGRK